MVLRIHFKHTYANTLLIGYTQSKSQSIDALSHCHAILVLGSDSKMHIVIFCWAIIYVSLVSNIFQKSGGYIMYVFIYLFRFHCPRVYGYTRGLSSFNFLKVPLCNLFLWLDDLISLAPYLSGYRISPWSAVFWFINFFCSSWIPLPYLMVQWNNYKPGL